jgi:nitroimidazol reductase NimA-like FMN-containing flavoprotein (pyridoxamine 5'-phosphate oxidase superfamily)
MTDYQIDSQNQIRRKPERGDYEYETVYEIVDESVICHVGFVQDGRPFVIPTIHARDNNTLILHGAKASHLLKHVAAGHEICVTITIVDGLVLARSVMHHSMNYRSAVLFGSGHIVEEKSLKLRYLELVVEHIMPGRWGNARLPDKKELNATAVVAMPIDKASAKIRSGPPVSD